MLLAIELWLAPGRGICGALGILLSACGLYFLAYQGQVLLSLGLLAAISLPMIVFTYRQKAPALLSSHARIEQGARGRALESISPSGEAVFVVDGKEKKVNVVSDHALKANEEVFVIEQSNGLIKVSAVREEQQWELG